MYKRQTILCVYNLSQQVTLKISQYKWTTNCNGQWGNLKECITLPNLLHECKPIYANSIDQLAVKIATEVQLYLLNAT